MVVNEEDRCFLNSIINPVLAQTVTANSQEMNTMTSNDQSNEERTIEDLPPSYRSILRLNDSNNPNTKIERQLIREIKEIRLRILDIFRILNRCEDNFLIALSFSISFSIIFAFLYYIYVYSTTPNSWDPITLNLKINSTLSTMDLEKNIFNDLKKTNSSLATMDSEKNIFNDLEKKIFND